MKNLQFIFLSLTLISSIAVSQSRPWRTYNYGSSCNTCVKTTKSCPLVCCNNPCGPYPRPLPGYYNSFKDNTRISFWNLPPCAPRNDSKVMGYLYKGMWWDNAGVRYWAIRNSTNNTITVDGLEGGELKDIPAGDVVNIERGESYAFRVQAPARRFELFSSDAHMIEIFINAKGDIDYRVEMPTAKIAKSNKSEPYTPKF